MADTDEDGETTTEDATFLQRWMATLPSNDAIGTLLKKNQGGASAPP